MVKRCIFLVLIPLLLTSCSQKPRQQVEKNDKNAVVAVGKLPATVVSPPSVEVVDARTLAVEGKHKPIEEMTDTEKEAYYDNRVSIPFSPDIKARLDGNPYEVIQYYLHAAKSENYHKCSACFSKNVSTRVNTITDELMGELRHEKKGYSIGEQCYNTGHTYIDDYKNKREFTISVQLWASGFTSYEYTLIHQNNTWRIRSVQCFQG